MVIFKRGGAIRAALAAALLFAISAVPWAAADAGPSQTKKDGPLFAAAQSPAGAIEVTPWADKMPAERVARIALAKHQAAMGLGDASEELSLTKKSAREKGRTNLRYAQEHQGVPVIGGEILVNLDGKNRLLSISGELGDVEAVDTHPSFASVGARDESLSMVAKHYGADRRALKATRPELRVYDPSVIGPPDGPSGLVWQVTVSGSARNSDLLDVLVLVDADNGSIRLDFNQIDLAMDRRTYTAGNTTTIPGTLICTESDPTCSAGDTDAKDAHKHAKQTYDFYMAMHGRDSWDGAGAAIISSVHYGAPGYANAFWSGTQMAYGDGYASADDVVGHELTHAVTDSESSLYYYYQSGAINESFSDVWGELLDLSNGTGDDSVGARWQMGEDLLIGAIRSMSDPPAFGDPDKMTSANYNIGSSDNGGVHTNSGVNNKAAYLMVDGGTFNGRTVTALGSTKTAKIYYKVQTDLLTSGANYSDLHTLLYTGCNSLIGTSGITSADCTEVRDATLAVEMDQEPVAGFLTQVNPCASGLPYNTYAEDMETPSLAYQNLVGANSWYTWAGYATNGISAVTVDDITTASDSTVRLTGAVAIPANAYLYFRHAYDTEVGISRYDGGVLEYSSDGGPWTDAAGLFSAGKDYDGAISGSFGNPLGGRMAFAGVTHGYTSSRYDLSALAGHNVNFRWRFGTDSSTGDWGWIVDDVRVVRCDTGLPSDPTSITSSHTAGAWSGDSTIQMNWPAVGSAGGASDAASGVDGYSYSFTTSATSVPDNVKDIEQTATSVISSAFAPGTYYFHIRTRDNSGQWTSTQHRGPYKIDTILPTVSFGSGAPVSGKYLRGTRTFPASASDSPSGVASVRWWDGGTPKATDSAVAYSFSINTKLLSNGKHTFKLQSKDMAGNFSAFESRTYRIDNYEPRTSAPFKETVKKGSRVGLSYKVKDPFTSYAYVKIKIKTLGGSTKKTLFVGWKKPGSTLRSYSYKATLPKGTYRFHVYAKDKAGNSEYNVASNKLVIK